jgi:hypothetical protein
VGTASKLWHRRSVSAVVAPAEIGNGFADLQFDRIGGFVGINGLAHLVRSGAHERHGQRATPSVPGVVHALARGSGCHGCANNSQPLMSDKLIATIKAATMESSTRHAAGRASTGASR